MDAQILYALIL